MSLPTCQSCVYATHKCGKTGVTIRRSTGCTFHEPKPQTNADRIRSMTDEELEMFMEEIASSGIYLMVDKDWTGDWLDWLKEEAHDERDFD